MWNVWRHKPESIFFKKRKKQWWSHTNVFFWYSPRFNLGLFPHFHPQWWKREKAVLPPASFPLQLSNPRGFRPCRVRNLGNTLLQSQVCEWSLHPQTAGPNPLILLLNNASKNLLMATVQESFWNARKFRRQQLATSIKTRLKVTKQWYHQVSCHKEEHHLDLWVTVYSQKGRLFK